jgi:hypothetical protein
MTIIKLRQLAYSAAAVLFMGQALVASSEFGSVSGGATREAPTSRRVDYGEPSPAKDPATRVTPLPKADGWGGNFKFTVLTGWYNTLTANLTSFFTRHEGYKQQIRSLKAELDKVYGEKDGLLREKNDLEAKLLLAQQDNAHKDETIDRLEEQVRSLTEDRRMLVGAVSRPASVAPSNVSRVVDANNVRQVRF